LFVIPNVAEVSESLPEPVEGTRRISSDGNEDYADRILDDFIKMWNSRRRRDVMKGEELVLQEAAETAERSGDLEAALDAWRALSSINVNRPDYLCMLGRVAQNLGRWAYAEKAFLDALKVDQTLSLTKTLLGSLFLTRTDGDRLANARKAKEWLEQAVAIAPNQASLSFLGSARARLGEKEAAKVAFRKVIELDASYPEAYFNLGLLLADEGQNAEAESLLRRATELDPNSSRAHGRLGILLHEQGIYSEAESEFRRAVEIDPTDKTAKSYLSRMPGSPADDSGVSN
jgi:tetratricopeptide (TPR) repeat protein